MNLLTTALYVFFGDGFTLDNPVNKDTPIELWLILRGSLGPMA